MITLPDRMKGLIASVEAGASPVEIQKSLREIALLQPLDLVSLGRRFVENAITTQEAQDDRLEQLLTGITPTPH